jgi:hypothetical protein
VRLDEEVGEVEHARGALGGGVEAIGLGGEAREGGERRGRLGVALAGPLGQRRAGDESLPEILEAMADGLGAAGGAPGPPAGDERRRARLPSAHL